MNEEKFRILLFDTKYRNPNHYICLAILAALKRHPDVEFVHKADPLDAISIASKNRCNLFIAFDGEELDAALCLRIATVCGRSILWVTEDPYELDVNRRHARLFDLVFTNDSSSVKAYAEKGRHLPLAGAVEFHSMPVERLDRSLRYDLFFAGTAWPNRSAFVRSILNQMPVDWKFKLALPSNPFLPPHGVGLPESSVCWRTSPQEFARFVNRSAITLLLPRVFSASGGREYAETPPPRLFEAALAGGVQMVHESLQEVALSFKPDDEIILFGSERDFLAKAARLIGDRRYRNKVADAARLRGLNEHTYDNRVDTILKGALGLKPAIPRVETKPSRTVLFVVHNVARRGNFGGVEVYLERIRNALGLEWKILFYVSGIGGQAKESFLLSGDYEEIRRFVFKQGYSPSLLTCSEYEQAFRNVILEHGIDLIHFHHFIGHAPSLVYVASQMGVPTAFTAHDFFPVCHEFNLLSFKNEFCGAPNVSISQCDACLKQKHDIPPGSQAVRRSFWDGVLRHIDLLIFNTEGTRQTYMKTYPSVRQHSRSIILPVPIPDGVARVTRRNSAALKIAVLGNVTYQKGGDVLSRVLPLLNGIAVELHLFGRVDAEYNDLARNGGPFKNVIVHGPYSIDALPEALKECEVSLHISIWPETYCLTLSEAWHLGLVPIVTDIGALGERVQHMINGLKISPNSEGQLVDAIRRLADDPSLLETLRAGISDQLFAQVSPHIEALCSEYRSLVRVRQPKIASSESVRHPPLADLGVVLQSPKWYRSGGDKRIPGLRGDQLKFKARRLVGFYQKHGIRHTLRLVASRLRKVR